MTIRNWMRISWLVCACLTVNAVQASVATDMHYRVYLDDEKIGYHKVRIEQTETNAKAVFVEASFDVNILFFNAYHYRHQVREQWQDGCLKRIDSSTNDNGENLSVRGHAEAGLFRVEATESRHSLRGCVMSFAYWNPAMLEATHLLNAQTGEYLAVDISHRGQLAVDIDGITETVDVYRVVSDKFTIDVWYSVNDEWIGLSTTTDNGSKLRYQRIQRGAQL